MAFGAIGLAIAPLLGGPGTQQTNATGTAVAVAITTGPQLQLLKKGEKRQFTQHASTPRRDVVCGRVVRLIIADVGLECRELHATQNLALARQ